MERHTDVQWGELRILRGDFPDTVAGNRWKKEIRGDANRERLARPAFTASNENWNIAMHNVSSICAPEILLALAKPGSRGQSELLWRKLELRQPPPLPVRKLRGEQPVVSTPQPRTQILA